MPAQRALPDYTRGPIVGSLLKLAVPIVGANILQTAYQLIDTFWVGRLGPNAVAAVSLSFPVLFLLIAMGAGVAVAGSVTVAQLRGMGNHAGVDRVAAQTLVMMIAVAAPLTVAGYVAAPQIMHAMGARGAVLPDAVSYVRISFLSLVFLFLYFAVQSLLRGVGEVRLPFAIVGFTVLLNLVLDPLFILGFGPIPAWGVAGAALSTLFTQGLAAAAGIALLLSARFDITLRLHALRPDAETVLGLLRLGLPASVEQSTRALGLIVMAALVATFGTVTVAAYGIGMRILTFVIIPALGLSMATSTLVGQNIGAGKLERARAVARASAWLGFGVLTGIGVLGIVFARPLVAAFIPGAHQAIAEGARFVRIIALSFGLLGVQQVLSGTFRGAGDTRSAMALALLSLWVMRVPLALVLSKTAGLAQLGVWIAFPASNVLGAGAAVVWFLSGRWQRARLTAGGSAQTATPDADPARPAGRAAAEPGSSKNPARRGSPDR